MILLIVFLVLVVIGQALAIFIALTVERLYSPYPGLVTFIALYFMTLWAAWRLAVRVTGPGRLGNAAK